MSFVVITDARICFFLFALKSKCRANYSRDSVVKAIRNKTPSIVIFLTFSYYSFAVCPVEVKSFGFL